MAAVIIGGMLSSTFLSLLVVPCMYTYFDDLQNLIIAIWHWRPFRSRKKVAPQAPPPMHGPAVPAASHPPVVGSRPQLEGVGGRR
jgi:hypothetical protein